MAKKKAVEKITPELLGHVTNGFGAVQGMENMFEGQMNDDPNKHLKELLTTDGDVDGKTELSPKQIRAIIKINYLASLLGEVKETKNAKGEVIESKLIPDPIILSIPITFKKLQISKGRASRKEFVQGIQGSGSGNKQEGMFNRIGQWFKGG